jgi:adenylate kinase
VSPGRTGGMRLVILGRQGSGKGTQSTRIVENFGLVHVSTGDMLRAAVSAGSGLGAKAKAIMDAGDLVPDDLMNEIVAERLSQPDVVAHGVLLDGFPRTTTQAAELEAMLGDGGVDAAINLDVPVQAVTERMLARGRADDTAEAIARRLELYENQTAPLLEWFDERGVLHTVDGIGDEHEVFDRICAVLTSVDS